MGSRIAYESTRASEGNTCVTAFCWIFLATERDSSALRLRAMMCSMAGITQTQAKRSNRAMINSRIVR